MSCCRCLLEQDPIAQRHMARINKYRGEYDRWDVTCYVSHVTCRVITVCMAVARQRGLPGSSTDHSLISPSIEAE